MLVASASGELLWQVADEDVAEGPAKEAEFALRGQQLKATA